MKSNFSACLSFTLKQEGGWSNNPADPGGCTMQGVTIAVYRDWKNNAGLTCTDLRHITPAEVSAIYQQNYWTASHGDDLPMGVDMMVWDMAVNAGVGRSARILQAALGVGVDGAIGPKTLAAVAAANPHSLILGLSKAQGDFYHRLPTFPTFGKGWMNRVNARTNVALAMLASSPIHVEPADPVAEKVETASTFPDSFFDFIKSIFT
jgi:lysozyme family protein